jgi:replicative DNA helicase
MDYLCNSPEGRDEMRKVRERLENLDIYQKAHDAGRRALTEVYAARKIIREMEIVERLSSHRFPHGGLSDLMHKIKTRPNLINYWAKIYNARRA